MPVRSGEHASLLCSPTWKRVASLLVLNREGGRRAGNFAGLAGGWWGVGGGGVFTRLVRTIHSPGSGGVVVAWVVGLLPLGVWVGLMGWGFPPPWWGVGAYNPLLGNGGGACPPFFLRCGLVGWPRLGGCWRVGCWRGGCWRVGVLGVGVLGVGVLVSAQGGGQG